MEPQFEALPEPATLMPKKSGSELGVLQDETDFGHIKDQGEANTRATNEQRAGSAGFVPTTDQKPAIGHPPPPSLTSASTDAVDAAHFSRLGTLQAAHVLYEAVQSADLARFSVLLSHCAGQPAIIDYSHGDGFTCLQYACDRRMDEFVDLLLEAGADPCAASPASGRTALHWAAAKDADILRQVLECAPAAAVNTPDALGCTPLHHAIQAGSPAAIRALLRAGADLSAPDDLGQPLLHSLPVDVLHEHLDSCVRGKRDGGDPDFGIEFDYALMWPRLPAGRTQFEMATVFHMADSEEHCPLLSHPLVWSFLDFKWWAASGLIIADLVFYSVFLALLTTLVFLRVENEILSETWDGFDRAVRGFYWATVGVTIPMIAAKVMQFLAAPIRFFLQWEDALIKAPVLVMTTVYLVRGAWPITLDGALNPQLSLASILVLLAWAQLFVHLSRIPSFAIYSKMYTTVFARFLWFLVWYGVVITGFAISMFIVFRDSEDRVHYDLSTPGLALLRTIVMVLDKMEINSLPLEHCQRAGNGTWTCPPSGQPTAAQLVFVMCLFFVTVVLTNLLNGLAISDTAALRSHAVAVSLASRARLLAYSESILLDGPLQFLGAVARPLGDRGVRIDSAPIRWLAAVGGRSPLRARLARWLGLDRRLPEHRLWVFPNRERERTCPALPGHWSLTEDVLERARTLVVRKGRDQPGLERQLSRLESQLERTMSDMGC
ncbi:Transient receptor potential cation channel protein painless [Amphibalanus amphitrite]|uniref:Transient receptor potential cation channel protein painless n=1 Tax=Amphibalanus amphitrite TaxID=1232801 RepID=A0A6A4WBB6_AMPAM|nr:Transient receptor potential cation channel protein painless [Amphibalanus amphitrite]